jgi:uncharacterized protein GlcG (DUF336 family)
MSSPCSASARRWRSPARRWGNRLRPLLLLLRHRPITNEQAKAVAAAAFAEARKNNSPMAVAIVGPAGELVYFEKMDGTQLASIEIAQGKARTAVMFRRPSKVFADQYAGRNRAFTTFPEKPVASEGGVPIVVDGKIIGAIGASGGSD